MNTYLTAILQTFGHMVLGYLCYKLGRRDRDNSEHRFKMGDSEYEADRILRLKMTEECSVLIDQLRIKRGEEDIAQTISKSLAALEILTRAQSEGYHIVLVGDDDTQNITI